MHFWPFWGNLGPFLSPNLNLSQTSHVTTQNNRKRGRISMEMVSEVTLNPLRSFWAISGSFWGHFGTILGQFLLWHSTSTALFCSQDVCCFLKAFTIWKFSVWFSVWSEKIKVLMWSCQDWSKWRAPRRIVECEIKFCTHQIGNTNSVWSQIQNIF